MYDLNEINERHGHYSSPYQDTESEFQPDKEEKDSTYPKQETAPPLAANEHTGVLKELVKRRHILENRRQRLDIIQYDRYPKDFKRANRLIRKINLKIRIIDRILNTK